MKNGKTIILMLQNYNILGDLSRIIVNFFIFLVENGKKQSTRLEKWPCGVRVAEKSFVPLRHVTKTY